jgi:hypothetical protein
MGSRFSNEYETLLFFSLILETSQTIVNGNVSKETNPFFAGK